MLKIKSYITAKFKISKVIVFMVLTIAAYAQDSTERDFSIITKSYVIEEFVQTLHDILLKDCIKTCVLLILCKSLNYNSNTKECQLSDKEKLSEKQRIGYIYKVTHTGNTKEKPVY